MKIRSLQEERHIAFTSHISKAVPLLMILLLSLFGCRRCSSFTKVEVGFRFGKKRQCTMDGGLQSCFPHRILSSISRCPTIGYTREGKSELVLPLLVTSVMRKPYDAPSKLSNVSYTQKRSRDGSKMTFEAAVMVEAKLIHGLDLLQQQLSHKIYYGNNHSLIQFPTTRECNAAIATFGNNPQFFMRGLQMFVKMRKAVSFYTKLNLNDNLLLIIPAPTLVTYSTLMSRAVSCNKPQVALRLWKLMTIQSNFFANCPPNITNNNANNIIVPDTKAANILMNVHAKLGDVLSAKALLQQMLSNSGGPDVPPLQPNLITYNTLIDACRRAGDLKTGLQLLQDMKLLSSLSDRTPIVKPDVRTYTSLISTVARKQLHKTTKLTFGTRDPDMAFALLYEMMQEQNLRPNGMTFCALIDVCGRCGRVDLALVGLRIMLRQQKQQMIHEREEDDPISSVGAWTAAIDACGKAGRYNTAIRLFQSMESFGAKPNIVTCGCLVDCLLRAKEEEDEGEDDRANISTKTIRILESLLDLLRYMKENYMEPSEVMYTSLISFAGRLVRIEEEEERIQRNTRPLPQTKNPKPWTVTTSEVLDLCNTTSGRDNDPMLDKDRISKTAPRAIDVYTELMKSMMRTSSSTMDLNTVTSGSTNTTAAKQSMLLKVFLVFQEMKGAGCIPDVTCYNSLLRACARAGDVMKAQDVVREMESNGILANDVTWKQLLKAAARSKSSYSAEQTWNLATNATSSTYQWKPDMEALEALIASYWGEAFLSPPSIDNCTAHTKMGATDTIPSHHQTKSHLLMSKIINLYLQLHSYSKDDDKIHKDMAKKNTNDGINLLSSMTLEELHGNQRLMLMILHSAVSLELMADDGNERAAKNACVDDVISAARKVAILISSLACLRKQEKQAAAFPFFAVGGSVMKRVWKSLELAKLWAEEEKMAIT